DIVVVMLDVSEPITDVDREIMSGVSELQHLVTINKIDKVSESLRRSVGERRSEFPDSDAVAVSAKTGEGLDALKNAIVQPFRSLVGSATRFLVSEARHHDRLLRAASDIDQSINSLTNKMSEEIVLIGLHN